MSTPDGSAAADLTDPALQRLLTAARRSLERTGHDVTASVGLTQLSDTERKAISGLLGRHIASGTKRVEINLTQLDARIQARSGATLIDALQKIKPLRHLPDEAARDASARAALLTTAHASPLHQTTWFPAWVDMLRTDGTFTRLIKAPWRFGRAVRTLELIDGSPIILPKLATRATGHSHALDHRTPLATLVLAALAARTETNPPKTTEERRELWDSFNVIVDDLASRVLVLNLAAAGPGLGDWLTSAATSATPFHITLHQLLNHPIHLAPPVVYACENPTVLREAADVLGPTCPPLICTEGQPSTAFHRLANKITGNGGQLRYHGDFDWPGIGMTTAIVTRHHAAPWRMTAADYLAALHHTSAADEQPINSLRGTRQPTPWEPLLSDTMDTHNQAIFEEAVVDVLIRDLRASQHSKP